MYEAFTTPLGVGQLAKKSFDKHRMFGERKRRPSKFIADSSPSGSKAAMRRECATPSNTQKSSHDGGSI
jgi:hypothetical protein